MHRIILLHLSVDLISIDKKHNTDNKNWDLHIRNSFAAAKIEKFDILTLLCKCPKHKTTAHFKNYNLIFGLLPTIWLKYMYLPKHLHRVQSATSAKHLHIYAQNQHCHPL